MKKILLFIINNNKIILNMDLGKVDLKTVGVAVITVFILLSLSSLISMLHAPKPCQMRELRRRMQEIEDLDDELIENFGNEEELVKRRDTDEYTSFSKFENKPRGTYSFKSTGLTAPSTSDDYPSSLLIGRADRYLIGKNSQKIFYLEIYCNLYVLGGDPFDKTDLSSIKQRYSAYLLDPANNKLYVGDLVKDGDGIYKLKIDNTTDTLLNKSVTDLMNYSKVNITYTIDGKEQLLLEGEF